MRWCVYKWNPPFVLLIGVTDSHLETLPDIDPQISFPISARSMYGVVCIIANCASANASDSRARGWDSRLTIFFR